jgi:argonaute-like protein implicated in RNA metabolism and viral defense
MYEDTDKRKPQHFLLLRDGDVKETELDIFSEVTGKFGIPNCAVVSIKKQTPYRIFRMRDGKILKPRSGDYFVIDKDLVMVCCAGVDEYEHGMPKPRVIEVKRTKGVIDAIKVARDVFYMSYLNWGSPSHSYSSPAPLRLAHKLASDLSKGLRPSGQPF